MIYDINEVGVADVDGEAIQFIRLATDKDWRRHTSPNYIKRRLCLDRIVSALLYPDRQCLPYVVILCGHAPAAKVGRLAAQLRAQGYSVRAIMGDGPWEVTPVT